MDDSLLTNIVEFISQINPFDQIPMSQIKELSSNIQINYLSKNEEIHSHHNVENENIYVIRTGSVEQKQPDGQVRSKLGYGDIFGFTWLNQQQKNVYFVKALENSLIYIIPNIEIQKLLKASPQLASHFDSNARIRLKEGFKVQWSHEEKGLFIQSISDVANNRVAVVNHDWSIRKVAETMHDKHRSSAVVMRENKLVGIVTDRDMTKRVVAKGINIDSPVNHIMSPSPYTVNSNDIVLSGIALMMRHNLRNLPVLENGQVVGILSATDLIQKHRMQAVFLINDIRQCDSLASLTALKPQRQIIFEALVEGGVSPENIGKVMTLIADAYHNRLIDLAQLELGEAPCSFSWFSAGSQAREEMQFISDQDNAIILPTLSSQSDKNYFLRLANFVCEGLALCGYPLCPGDFMANNPKWCKSINEWKEDYTSWFINPESEALLNSNVFMDIRHIRGSQSLFNELKQHVTQLTNNNSRLYSILIANGLRVRPPLGVFGGFVLVQEGQNRNKLNLKNSAICTVIDLARVYSLQGALSETNTQKRLGSAVNSGIISHETFSDIFEAYQLICSIRLKHQVKTLQSGGTPDNYIDPKSLSHFERHHLKDAFRMVRELQEAAQMKYSSKGLIR